MENRISIEFKLEPVFFFEAKIGAPDKALPVKTITSKNLREVEQEVNIWLKCGNYSLLSVERVERQQLSLS